MHAPMFRPRRALGILAIALTCSCSKPDVSTPERSPKANEAKLPTIVEAPPNLPTDATASTAPAQPDPAKLDPKQSAAEESSCGVTQPRASGQAYARACAHLEAGAKAGPSAPPPASVPSDWQAVRSELGTFYVPPDWVLVREGDSLLAVAPGTPSAASGLHCSLTTSLLELDAKAGSEAAIAELEELLAGMFDGELSTQAQRRRGIETVRLDYAMAESQWRERLYLEPGGESLRQLSCIDGSRERFAGTAEHIEQILDSLQPVGGDEGAPSEACACDNFVPFPGPVDWINVDLAPLINAPGSSSSLAFAEVDYYTQCSYWATLLPLSGEPAFDAIIVGYEALDERDQELAPARLTLRGPRYTPDPEGGRPASLPTEVVVIEPADSSFSLLPTQRPSTLTLDAGAELVAVVGQDGLPSHVFARTQRDGRSCLLQYLSFDGSKWELARDSCKPRR